VAVNSRQLWSDSARDDVYTSCRSHNRRYRHSANDISVQAPTLSDHSFITANVDLQFGRGRFAGSIRRRQWRCFDYDAFRDDLCQSDLLRNHQLTLSTLSRATTALFRRCLTIMHRSSPSSRVPTSTLHDVIVTANRPRQLLVVLNESIGEIRQTPIARHGNVSPRHCTRRCDRRT